MNTESINSNINQEAIDHQEFVDKETSELKRHGEAFELKREEPFSVNAADMNGMVGSCFFFKGSTANIF